MRRILVLLRVFAAGVVAITVLVAAPAAAGAGTPPTPLGPTDLVIAPSANGVVTAGNAVSFSALYRAPNNVMKNVNGQAYSAKLEFTLYKDGLVINRPKNDAQLGYWITRSPTRQEVQSTCCTGLSSGSYELGVRAVNANGSEVVYGPESRKAFVVREGSDSNELANGDFPNYSQCTNCFVSYSTQGTVPTLTIPANSSIDAPVSLSQVVANSFTLSGRAPTGIGSAAKPSEADLIYVGAVHLETRVWSDVVNNGGGSLTLSYVDRAAPLAPTLQYPASLGGSVSLRPIFDVGATSQNSLRLTNSGPSPLRVQLYARGWTSWMDGDELSLTDDEVVDPEYSTQDVGSVIQSGADDARSTLPPAAATADSCGQDSINQAFADSRSSTGTTGPVDVRCVSVSPVTTRLSDADRQRSLSVTDNDSTKDQEFSRASAPLVNTGSCYQDVTKDDWATKRYAMCSARRFVVTLNRQPNCCSPYVEVGKYTFIIYRDIALGQTNTRVSFSMQAAYEGCSGALCGTTALVRLTAWCDFSCGTEKFLDTSLSSTDPYSGLLSNDFSGTLSSVGSSKDMRIGTRVDYLNTCPPGCKSVDDPHLDDSYIVRCDNFAYFNQGAGCTVPAFEPTFTLDLNNPNIDESAAFIQRVQINVYHWGIPDTTPAAWLTRANKTNRDKNRKAACAGFIKSKTGSCDEFPFASTNEGCFTGGTLINCNRADVLLSDNVNAGRKLGSFYQRTRLKRDFVDDQFYVRIR